MRNGFDTIYNLLVEHQNRYSESTGLVLEGINDGELVEYLRKRGFVFDTSFGYDKYDYICINTKDYDIQKCLTYLDHHGIILILNYTAGLKNIFDIVSNSKIKTLLASTHITTANPILKLYYEVNYDELKY